MNKIVKGFFIFIAGAAIGVIGTKKFFEERYSRLAQDEIDSIKEVYTYKRSGNNEENEPEPELSENEPEHELSAKELATNAINKPDILEYANIIKKEGYASDDKLRNHSGRYPWGSNEESIRIIDPENFGEVYTTVTMTYYADGTLEDDFNGVVTNPEELVGDEYYNHFGEYEKDIVFVRNDKTRTDYEISRDDRSYSETHEED